MKSNRVERKLQEGAAFAVARRADAAAHVELHGGQQQLWHGQRGIAALAQIDKSLDEASATMGAGALQTLRRVVLPLLRPAIVAALAYSFVHAMTAVSAVIFLVSARHNLATVYIVGRVEAGEMALAIAYSTVLIVVMLAVVLGIERLVGRAQIGRRAAPAGNFVA